MSLQDSELAVTIRAVELKKFFASTPGSRAPTQFLGRVAYRSLQEAYLDSLGPFADVVVALLASIAKLEREKIRERTLAGLARARKAGRVGGRPKAEDDDKLVHKLRKLQVEGKSIRAIATELGISPTTVLKLQRQC